MLPEEAGQWGCGAFLEEVELEPSRMVLGQSQDQLTKDTESRAPGVTWQTGAARSALSKLCCLQVLANSWSSAPQL